MGASMGDPGNSLIGGYPGNSLIGGTLDGGFYGGSGGCIPPYIPGFRHFIPIYRNSIKTPFLPFQFFPPLTRHLGVFGA